MVLKRCSLGAEQALERSPAVFNSPALLLGSSVNTQEILSALAER